MLAADNDEVPLPSAYISAEVTGVNDDLDKSLTESVKEANKQITTMD